MPSKMLSDKQKKLFEAIAKSGTLILEPRPSRQWSKEVKALAGELL